MTVHGLGFQNRRSVLDTQVGTPDALSSEDDLQITQEDGGLILTEQNF